MAYDPGCIVFEISLPDIKDTAYYRDSDWIGYVQIKCNDVK